MDHFQERNYHIYNCCSAMKNVLQFCKMYLVVHLRQTKLMYYTLLSITPLVCDYYCKTLVNIVTNPPKICPLLVF